MNKIMALFLFGSISAFAALPHLDPEMTGAEYEYYLNRVKVKSSSGLDFILQHGKRNLEWLKEINAIRPPEKQISFSSAATQKAYPITEPGFNNPTIAKKRFEDFKMAAPQWFVSIVIDGETMNPNLPVTDAEYIALGLELDRIYQSASRWILQEPYLFQYTMRQADDVRGYYFLHQDKDLQSKLDHLSQLPMEQQNQIGDWMVQLCGNSEGFADCEEEWEESSTNGKSAWKFYQKYLSGGASRWKEYFEMGGYRDDVRWTSAEPNTMWVPFITPETDALKRFLSDNIEEEWQFNGWKLKMDFQGRGTAHLEFEAGATPNVNGLGGDVITMDANAPLTEYNVQWTIRHEYGHVLGLPDCYVEFYDDKAEKMVNYQLDITNLMCSRRGHIQEIHYTELKKAYFE